MPWIWKARESEGLASVSSLASTTWPSRLAASRSRIGPSWRHGPHHSAQKSTTTGVVAERSSTSAWKVASLTSMTMQLRVRNTAPVLATDDTGGNGPAIVLLHGLTASRRYVVMGSKALERTGHRVIAYDARGHGESDPAQPYDYPALAGDLRGVLDAHGVGAAVLAGASMGAHTALRFALDHPERVGGLVVITPAYLPDEPTDLERWDSLAAGLREGGVEGFVAAYGEPAVPEQWRETVLMVIRQRLGQHLHPEAVADALEQVPRSAPFGGVEDLRGIAVPTAVVASRDEADPGHPLHVGEAYAAAIPDARLVVEEPGRSPIAWQGGQLSKVIADVASRAEVAA